MNRQYVVLPAFFLLAGVFANWYVQEEQLPAEQETAPVVEPSILSEQTPVSLDSLSEQDTDLVEPEQQVQSPINTERTEQTPDKHTPDSLRKRADQIIAETESLIRQQEEQLHEQRRMTTTVAAQQLQDRLAKLRQK